MPKALVRTCLGLLCELLAAALQVAQKITVAVLPFVSSAPLFIAKELIACARRCAPYPLRSTAGGKSNHQAIFRRVHSSDPPPPKAIPTDGHHQPSLTRRTAVRTYRSAPPPQANPATKPSFVGCAAPLRTPHDTRIPRRRQITPPSIAHVRTAHAGTAAGG